MAKKTCKGLTYAKYASGGDGSAITYAGGTAKVDYLCKVDITETRDNQKEHADGHQIDAANKLTACQVALELANNDADIKKDMLGHQVGTGTGELDVTGGDAPFVGVGFILCNRFKGTETYEGYWFYKVQFSTGGVSSSTMKDQMQWEHETINGESMGVVLTSGGDVLFYTHLDAQTTEAAVRTWLNGKAGISSGAGGGGG
jgi:phi13 family phage major tail protein